MVLLKDAPPTAQRRYDDLQTPAWRAVFKRNGFAV